MDRLKRNPSLSNYLDLALQSCTLQISLISENEDILEKSNFPFLEAAQIDPWHRLLKGKFITEASSEIREVFLLTQRDKYLTLPDELWPLTNKDIDLAWQKALKFYWQEKRDGCIFLFSPEDEYGEVSPAWAPTFFCKKEKIFFPILCPQCGMVLQLCQEDSVLSEAGLPLYSHSLERYLYCPNCWRDGRREFFSYDLEQVQSPFLNDRFALIKELAILFSTGISKDLFPCSGCCQQSACFGAENLALSRITPFSFYPFYMLIFKAMSLNAQDFIPLLGGATWPELKEQIPRPHEIGRKTSLESLFQGRSQEKYHLFASQENFFGEVLYLKLSFLNEVVRQLFMGNNFFNHPQLRLSLAHIWVDLAYPQSLLPAFWNFQVSIMPLPESWLPSSLPKLPESETYYFLGQLWFYTLLVNKQQSISQVYSALPKAQEVISSSPSFSEHNLSPVFGPANIFWNPENKKIPPHLLPFWQKALELGWVLLMFSWDRKYPLNKESFLEELSQLREEVKAHIFRVSPIFEKRSFFQEDKAIGEILQRILSRWEIGKEPGIEAVETVLLTPEKVEKEKGPQFVSEEAPETVIIPPKEKEKRLPSQREEQEEEVAQTIILYPHAPSKEKPFAPPPQAPLREEIAETVILKPSSPKEDLPPETVLISPAPKAKREAEKDTLEELSGETKGAETESRAGKEEDFLSETVIIQPSKKPDKGKHGAKK